MKFSWNDASQTPRVVVTAEDQEFDNTTLQNWIAEGFEVSYLPFTTNRKAYIEKFQDVAESLELGEKYAIVGQGHFNRAPNAPLFQAALIPSCQIRSQTDLCFVPIEQHMAKPLK